MLTYELLTGASPFTIEGDKNTQQDISKRIISAEPMMPDILSPDVKDFILKVRDNWHTNLGFCILPSKVVAYAMKLFSAIYRNQFD